MANRYYYGTETFQELIENDSGEARTITRTRPKELKADKEGNYWIKGRAYRPHENSGWGRYWMKPVNETIYEDVTDPQTGSVSRTATKDYGYIVRTENTGAKAMGNRQGAKDYVKALKAQDAASVPPSPPAETQENPVETAVTQNDLTIAKSKSAASSDLTIQRRRRNRMGAPGSGAGLGVAS